ncbi:hypothetical protein MPTK1_1g04940 [Marchantia polymorpha subsp. ruderalis]|uniref:ROCO family protein n=1 Tax=Marchantia polymorpha subsp. ruderalis TaxID=1480154 RepID=A0AAF6ALL6_MARPO|nr:hypothetical protein Mp_1g04940 [Marchantia polymorpha subsp. ruderalis]
MEVVGASIVTIAAELDTRRRGMDSADEEPELPREVDAEVATREMDSDEDPKLLRKVEDLLQRLEGKGETITRLRDLGLYRFGSFSPGDASLSAKIGWRSQLRLRLLEAIGNCNTLDHLDVGVICGGEAWSLTDSEWDVVMRGFRSSTILREIRFGGLSWSSDTEVESLCLQLGRILSTSSVTRLEIDDCPLTARCFLNLSSGLRGNSDSNLKYLGLKNAWGHLSAVKRVADMINSAPLLETLSLRHSRYDMDEEPVGIVSQALIHSSSLKKMTLDDGTWGAALLLKALAGDDRNHSIERLLLGMDTLGMERLGDCIRELLTSNPSLKEVRMSELRISNPLKKMRLSDLRMRPEKWHQLGEVIRDNAIKKVSLSFRASIDWKSIEALAQAASSDVKDPKMELQLVVSDDHDEWMLSLNLLGRVQRGEIKSLKSLSILASDPRTSGTNQDRLGRILSVNRKPGETSVLKRLRLSVNNKDVLKGVWKDLLRCLREDTSLTHLDLSRSVLQSELVFDEEAFRDLMGLLQVNLTLEEIDVSGTSWQTDGKAAKIQEALKQNRKQAVYMSVFREAKLTFGAAKAGRLFLCGSPRAGKTQLRRTLMSVIQGNSWLASKWNKLRTKGIEVEFLQNNEEMQISVWDLAGQWIFRTLQNVLFPQTNNFCVFLFVYSPFCTKTSSNKPDSCFRSELEEWLNFLHPAPRSQDIIFLKLLL